MVSDLMCNQSLFFYILRFHMLDNVLSSSPPSLLASLLMYPICKKKSLPKDHKDYPYSHTPFFIRNPVGYMYRPNKKHKTTL